MGPTLEHIQAYPAELIYVWVVYPGQEANLRRSHGIVIRKEELGLEDAT